jgi:WD40 repeat protein
MPFDSVSFSPDGRLLATTDPATTAVRVWDASTGRLLHSFSGSSGSLKCAAFAPAGPGPVRVIAGGHSDGRVRLWDLVASPNPLTLPGHETIVTSVAFSKDSHLLATSSPDERTVLVWDTAAGTALRKLTGFAFQVAISPDNKLLAGAGGDTRNTDRPGAVRIWDLKTGQELPLLQGYQHSRFAQCVAFSPDGKWLASTSGDYHQKQLDAQAGEICVWDVASGKPAALRKLPAGYVIALAFSPDSRSLALACSDKTVALWDAATLEPLRTYPGHTDPAKSITFSADGDRLAAGSSSGLVIVWDTATARETLRFRADKRTITGLAFSPDGARLATASFDVTARGLLTLWDAHSGREVIGLPGQMCVAFSRDGQYLAAAGAGDALQSGGAKLWKAMPRP